MSDNTTPLRHSSDDAPAVAVNMAVRFKSSPRLLAPKLVHVSAAGFGALVHEYRNGAKTYEQTGYSKNDLAKGVLAAAAVVASKRPFPDWKVLESTVKHASKRHCGGTTLENFLSRQVAADLCRRSGFVGNLAPGRRPKSSKLGPGAKIGWLHAQRALRKKHRGLNRISKSESNT